MPELKETRAGGPRSGARLGFSLGRMLVVSQMAICLLLLVGAGSVCADAREFAVAGGGFSARKYFAVQIECAAGGPSRPGDSLLLQRSGNASGGDSGRAQRDYGEFAADRRRGMGLAGCSDGKSSGRRKRRPDMARVSVEPLPTSWGPDRDSFRRCTFRCWRGANSTNATGIGAVPVAIVNEAWVKANLEGRKSRGAARHQLWAADEATGDGNHWAGKEREVRRFDG